MRSFSNFSGLSMKTKRLSNCEIIKQPEEEVYLVESVPTRNVVRFQIIPKKLLKVLRMYAKKRDIGDSSRNNAHQKTCHTSLFAPQVARGD